MDLRGPIAYLMLLPLAALAVLGFAMIRSAWLDRDGNWVAGFVLGSVFTLFGLGGMIGWIVSGRW